MTTLSIWTLIEYGLIGLLCWSLGCAVYAVWRGVKYHDQETGDRVLRRDPLHRLYRWLWPR